MSVPASTVEVISCALLPIHRWMGPQLQHSDWLTGCVPDEVREQIRRLVEVLGYLPHLQPLGVVTADAVLLAANQPLLDLLGAGGAEQLVAPRPKEVQERLVGGEQHGVGRDHAERLQVRQVAEHLDEPADLLADFVRHAPREPVAVLELRSHPPVYRQEGARYDLDRRSGHGHSSSAPAAAPRGAGGAAAPAPTLRAEDADPVFALVLGQVQRLVRAAQQLFVRVAAEADAADADAHRHGYVRGAIDTLEPVRADGRRDA